MNKNDKYTFAILTACAVSGLPFVFDLPPMVAYVGIGTAVVLSIVYYFSS